MPAAGNFLGGFVQHILSLTDVQASLGGVAPYPVSSSLEPGWTPFTRAIIVRASGGPAPWWYASRMFARLDIFVYGTSESDALDQWGMLHEDIVPDPHVKPRGFVANGVTFEDVWEEVPARLLTEQDTNWPYVVGTVVTRFRQ